MRGAERRARIQVEVWPAEDVTAESVEEWQKKAARERELREATLREAAEPEPEPAKESAGLTAIVVTRLLPKAQLFALNEVRTARTRSIGRAVRQGRRTRGGPCMSDTPRRCLRACVQYARKNGVAFVMAITNGVTSSVFSVRHVH